MGSVEMKLTTSGKIVSYKCCPLSLNISLKKVLKQTFFLTNVVTHFQLLSVTLIEYGHNVNKHISNT